MGRQRIFFHTHVTKEDRRAMRKFCADKIRSARGLRLPLLPFFEVVAPIEPVIAYDLLFDFAWGCGYEGSAAATKIDRKAYYRRKNHMLYCVLTAHPNWLAPYYDL